MSQTTIRVTKETQDLLLELKDRLDEKSYDSCINNLALYCIRNNINPKRVYTGEIQKFLLDLEVRLTQKLESTQDRITKDNASLRRWVGGITKDHLVPISEKISVLDKIDNIKINQKLTDDYRTKIERNPINNNVKSEEEEEKKTDQSKVVNEELQTKFDNLWNKYEEQKKILFEIFNNAKVEKGGMLSPTSIVIKSISAEQWEKYKEECI